MKLTLVVLSLVCIGCFATPIEVQESKVKKRSVSGDLLGGYYGGSYGLSAFAAPSISSLAYSAPSISSHTHTHSTAIVERPYPVPVHTPAITTTSFLPSYNYGFGSYLSNIGNPYGSLGFGKYYSRSYPSIYKKSYYSSPSYRYKW